MAIINPRIASGFPEYLPEEQIEFNRLLEIIRTTYESYGFTPIDTPDLELKDVLLAKAGGETEKQVYEFTRGKNDFCMRFDLTVPLARYVAQHQGDIVFPFRRYHIGKVHRAERAQAGRFREFYQCDIDTIGSNSSIVDAEFPAIINEIFDKFQFGEFTIRINDRRILNGFFESLQYDGPSVDIMRLVDKIEKMPLDEFKGELAKIGLNNGQIGQIIDFVTISGTNEEITTQLASLGIQSEMFDEGVNNLKEIHGALLALGVPERRFRFDLKIARGLDYYTGTVYETFLNDHPEVGSVCSGGRYDNLASLYTNTELPGVGISIGLSRLFYKLMQLGVIKPEKRSMVNVLICPVDKENIPLAIRLSSVLRAGKIGNMLYSEDNTLKKKLRYADRMGMEYCLIIGESEAENGTVTVKNMKSGDNHTIDQKELVAFLSEGK